MFYRLVQKLILGCKSGISGFLNICLQIYLHVFVTVHQLNIANIKHVVVLINGRFLCFRCKFNFNFNLMQDSKENDKIEDKPKRKLPDPEKLYKKPSPHNTPPGSQLKTAPGDEVDSPSPCMPPIQASPGQPSMSRSVPTLYVSTLMSEVNYALKILYRIIYLSVYVNSKLFI